MTTNTTESLDDILAELLGAPLDKDATYVPTSYDPYGKRQLENTSVTDTPKSSLDYGSYETVKRQYGRVKQAKDQLEAYIEQEKLKERAETVKRCNAAGKKTKCFSCGEPAYWEYATGGGSCIVCKAHTPF